LTQFGGGWGWQQVVVFKKELLTVKTVGLSDVWRPVSSGQIDYHTKKDPVSFLSYFQKHRNGSKKVQINRGKGLIDLHAAKYLY
jgi:hypothetical protein